MNGSIFGTAVRLAVLVGVLATGALWPIGPGTNPPAVHAAPVREPVPEPGRDLFGDPLPPGAVARFGTVAFRPRTVADQLAFDASGRVLFSVGMTASAWDVATGRELLSVIPPGLDGCLWAAQLDPDGRTVVTLAQDFPRPELYLHRWSIADQNETVLPELKLAALRVRPRDKGHATGSFLGPGYTFTPDGNMLALLDQGGDVVLWDVPMGREFRRLTDAGSPASAIGFTPRGGQIVTAHDDHEFRVWDVATGIEVRRFAGPAVEVTQLSFSADRRRMSAVSYPMKPGAPKVKTVSVWDTERGQEIRTIETDSQRVMWASLTPDGMSVISTEVVSADGCALRRYDLSNGRAQTLSPAGGPRAGTLAISPDGRTLAAATVEGPIHFWDVPSGVEKQPRGLPGNVNTVAVAPDGQTAWTRTWQGPLVQWDVSTGREIRRLKAESALPMAMALSADGKLLAAGETRLTDKRVDTIALWDTTTGQLLRRIPAVGQRLTFTADGRMLASHDQRDGRIRFWNSATGEESRPSIQGEKSTQGRWTTNGLTFLDNGRKLLAFGGEFAIVWDIKAGGEPRRYTTGGSAVSADGRLLVTSKPRAMANVAPGQTPCEVEIVDLKTGDIVTRADVDHWGGCVTISPNGGVLAVAYHDGEYRSGIDVWNLKTKLKLGTFEGHRRSILSLVFTPDGRRLISGSQDTTALVWQVPQ